MQYLLRSIANFFLYSVLNGGASVSTSLGLAEQRRLWRTCNMLNSSRITRLSFINIWSFVFPTLHIPVTRHYTPLYPTMTGNANGVFFLFQEIRSSYRMPYLRPPRRRPARGRREWFGPTLSRMPRSALSSSPARQQEEKVGGAMP